MVKTANSCAVRLFVGAFNREEGKDAFYPLPRCLRNRKDDRPFFIAKSEKEGGVYGFNL